MARDAGLPVVSTVDYHTAGEPFCIVTGGIPSLPGSCVADRREHAAAHLDHVRRLLVLEPRGASLTRPARPATRRTNG